MPVLPPERAADCVWNLGVFLVLLSVEKHFKVTLGEPWYQE